VPISEQRRRDLVNAAISSIAQHGYQNVTVKTICEAAGFSRGLIGHYFLGKEQLLLEAARQLAGEFRDITRDAANLAGAQPADRLRAVLSSCFRPPMFTVGRISVWVALAGTARWSPSVAEIYRELRMEFRQVLSRLIARAADDRAVAVNATRAALTVAQMVEGFWVGWVADEAAVSPAEAEGACQDYLALLLAPPSQ
jgi:TetR/AcrR family transcriptional regulator, transcriptional repressor of bet genes